ncbi:uncharacterized protein LOC129943345 [Eupeodes corollae]|uniref:uncharacterized protein LOC129943345 n=1 Tax=Eupeodes corollae TaxID=290404 RepID=UPI0024915541|nr:uncharacterized protein LOC129943345 [Eupeodes corollae]
MIMSNKIIQSRTGIYVQESVGATTTGDGLDLRGYKSPVAQTYDNTEHNQEQNRSNSRNALNTNSKPLDSIISIEQDSKSDYDINIQSIKKYQRYERMKEEFLKLGFQNHEINAMKEALEEERKRRSAQNVGTTKQILEENTKIESVGLRIIDDSRALKNSLEDEQDRHFDEINLDPKLNFEQQPKFSAEKAAKTATGTFSPTKFVGHKDRNRDKGGNFGRKEIIPKTQLSKINKDDGSPKVIFISPAILAGARENDCACSMEKKREASHQLKQMEFGRIKNFAEARQRMGLSGEHIERSTTLDSQPEIQIGDDDDDDDGQSNTQNLIPSMNKYPFEVQILNKPHPFGELPEEVWFIMLDALETTIQDERATGADWLKIKPGQFKQRRLHVICENIESVKWLKTKMHLYNRLWQGADLYLTTNLVSFKRSKYKVDIRNYNLTSEEFFKIIKKQNNFPTEYWTLYYKDRQNDRFKAFFSVDPESAKRLEETNGFVYFFFEKIQFIYQIFK